MKKNLLYLWALICSVALFTACSSDDDNDISGNNPPEEEAVVTAPDVVGTYWGNLDILMKPDNSDQETVIGNGIAKFITISQVSDTEVKMELKEFELFLNGTIMKFGDIVIDKCTVKKETDASTFTGQQNLTFSGVEGTVESGALTMNINVKVATLQQTVKVTYSGVKQVEESGNN